MRASVLIFAASAAFGAASARADEDVAPFYASHPIHLILGHPPGGDYDLGGRLLARHLSRHIPGNPQILVQNMPAAASIVAANFM